MACPTCDKTMAGLGHGVFHCPCCGTVKQDDAVYVPALVGRCREFGAGLVGVCAEHAHQWKRLGIAEAIHLPADRAG